MANHPICPGRETFCPKTGTAPNRPRQLVTASPVPGKACSFTGGIMKTNLLTCPGFLGEANPVKRRHLHTVHPEFPICPLHSGDELRGAARVQRV